MLKGQCHEIFTQTPPLPTQQTVNYKDINYRYLPIACLDIQYSTTVNACLPIFRMEHTFPRSVHR